MPYKKTIQGLILITILLASFALPATAGAGPSSCGCCCQQNCYTNTYIVKSGDTFSQIARYYGVGTWTLWSYNRHIWNINLIYPGQVIYVPSCTTTSTTTTTSSSSSWMTVVPSSNEPLVERSYGAAPVGTPNGRVKLVNNANADVYVSLQGTTRDGVKVINEYPVSGSMNVRVPSGWYLYVAWVGGTKYSGEFQLYGDSSRTISFFMHKVTVK